MSNRNDASSGRGNTRERRLPETKSFILSSEFWVFAVAVAALLFAAYVLDDIANPTAWRYAAFVAIAYIVTRGLAKAGSSREYEPRAMAQSGASDDRDYYRERGDRTEAEWSERRSQAVGRDVGSEAPRA
jgi:hypothetical protein